MNVPAFIAGYMVKEAGVGKLISGASRAARRVPRKALAAGAAGVGALGIKKGGEKVNDLINSSSKKRLEEVESASGDTEAAAGKVQTPKG
jgi:hypothetical protein